MQENNSSGVTIITVGLVVALLIGLGYFAYTVTKCDDSCVQLKIEQQKTAQIIAENQMKVRVAEATRLAEIEAQKTPEQKALEQQIALQKSQAESLKYLENSKKVHDTIDTISFGLGVISALSN